MRFRCLLLDHDDTTVRGTEEVHYPAHVESLRQLRPDLEPCSLEEWSARTWRDAPTPLLRGGPSGLAKVSGLSWAGRIYDMRTWGNLGRSTRAVTEKLLSNVSPRCSLGAHRSLRRTRARTQRLLFGSLFMSPILCDM